jgi:hypothetical protein
LIAISILLFSVCFDKIDLWASTKSLKRIEFSWTHGGKTYIEIEMSTSINMNSGEIIHPEAPFNFYLRGWSALG